VFGGPTIIGLIFTFVFWWKYRHFDDDSGTIQAEEHQGHFLDRWQKRVHQTKAINGFQVPLGVFTG
jgi:hypothetical protein